MGTCAVKADNPAPPRLQWRNGLKFATSFVLCPIVLHEKTIIE